MDADWRDYQENVAAFFRELGLDAETDVTLKGARTQHNVDVVVTTVFMGQPILWLVECKAWQARIPKEKVLALRQIVDDVGADRGFMMNENGFQTGALEAALLSNVQLTSLAELAETCGYDFALEQLRRIYERIWACRERYWDIPKSVRIDYGLRGDLDPRAYSGDRVISTVESCAIRAILSGFPVVYDEVLVPISRLSGGTIDPSSDSVVFDEPNELVSHLSGKITELERLLTKAENGAR